MRFLFEIIFATIAKIKIDEYSKRFEQITVYHRDPQELVEILQDISKYMKGTKISYIVISPQWLPEFNSNYTPNECLITFLEEKTQ